MIDIFKNLVKTQNKCLIVVTHSDLVRSASDIAYELSEGKLTRLEAGGGDQ